MEEKTTAPRRRLYSIDLLKFCSAVLIFAFHGNMHMGLQFGPLTDFISQGAIFMDLFFMLSGFVLYDANRGKRIAWEDGLKEFYFKRLAAIYPLYLFVILVFCSYPTEYKLLTLPAELLLLQAWFPGFFAYSHNGGTWFISCLMFCYLLFPALQYVLCRISRRIAALLLGVGYLLCAVSPFVVLKLGLAGIYDNPLIRLLHFLSGMVLAKLLFELRSQIGNCLLWIGAGSAGFVWAVTRLCQNGCRNDYLRYGFLTFPFFLLLIALAVCGERRKQGLPHTHSGGGVLETLPYPIFIAQFFVWQPVGKILSRFPAFFETNGNLKTAVVSVGVLVLIVWMLIYFVDKPSRRLLRFFSGSRGG